MIEEAMRLASQDKLDDNSDTSAQESVNGTSLLQFKLQLKHSGSPVWRRVLIPDNWSFAGFHAVIQAVFEWQELRPHNFVFAGKVRIESEKELEIMTDTNPNIELRSEGMTEIAEIFSRYEHGIYTYDFNENWEHDIIFERVLPREPATVYPRCIKAKGSAPSDRDYEQVDTDIDAINIRLALLVPKSRLFVYMNPYEWHLESCLARQRMLSLRAIGRFLGTSHWSKINKDRLIKALKVDIIKAIGAFIKVETDEDVTEIQLMAYLLARHESELPFESELYQACFKSEHDVIKIVKELKKMGFVYELAELDRDQLPASMRENPDVFHPVLVMPIEVKRECLKHIFEDDVEKKYRERICF